MLESILNSLHVAQEANAAVYRRVVQTSAPGDCWDVLVLTAANEKQAQGYRQELALRHRVTGPGGAFFPAIQKSVVVADPPGRRAGSGGATLGILQALHKELEISLDELTKLRILLIHSGGASQRLPAYSPLGKIFAPLPLLRPDGGIATLFDHLYITLAGLPDRLGAGMLVLAGDVFLLLDHRHVSAPKPGVTAISMRVEAELGRGHGIFVTDANGRIQQTLQKVSVETMKSSGAADAEGNILIDTGLLFFDPGSLSRLGQLAGLRRGRKTATAKSSAGIQTRYPQQIDLYDDMTAALAAGTQRGAYLTAGASVPIRRELWKSLHGVPFNVMEVQGQFLHLGTTLQFRDAMVGQNLSPAAELFQQNVLAYSQWKLPAGRRVYHSSLLAHGGRTGTLGERSVVEHSILRAPCDIGQGCVVSQVVSLRRPLVLGDDLLLFQAPVRAESGVLFVQVLCGVQDNFKGRYGDGECRYLNADIDAWLSRHGISSDALWKRIPADRRTLWTARLFPACPQRDSTSDAIWMSLPRKADRKTVQRWEKSPRYSMAMILDSADPAALIEHREVVAAYLQASEVIDSIRRRESRPLDDLVGHHNSPAAYEAAIGILSEFGSRAVADPASALDQARAEWVIGQLLSRADHPLGPSARSQIDLHQQRAFARIALASELGHRSIVVKAEGEAKFKPGLLIEASSPVRLDLSGGWSDTPPYCFEEGGHVINVAIDLDGRPPARAIVRTLRQPALILESTDLGNRIELPLAKVAKEVPDVRDPFSLHRIAIDMTGLIAGGKGPGLHVLTECRVPKGSGLGTSSILGATLLAALHKVRNVEPSTDELIEQTLLLEQRLSTGGGWQDQVGGIVGGVKSTITAPGTPQHPVVEQLPLSDSLYDALDERLVVYYSGQQRLARDILRRVEGRWIGREPAAVLLKRELKESARELREAMLRGQWMSVAREISRYWRIKKDLYPGSTTPSIDVLLLELKDHYLAAGLAGAGGGGFAYFFCQDGKQAARLRELLTERSSRPGFPGSVYATQINRTGLSVTRRHMRT